MDNDYLSSYRLRSNTNTYYKVKESERMKYEFENLKKSNCTTNDVYNLNPNRHLFNTNYKENTLRDHNYTGNMTYSNYDNTKSSNQDYTPSIRNKTVKHTFPYSNEKLIRNTSKIIQY
jgi:hypothetical protein